MPKPLAQSSATPAPEGGAFARRWSGYAGIFFDEFATDSAWIREVGTIRLPPLDSCPAVVLHGEFRPHPAATGLERTPPTLACAVNGTTVGQIEAAPKSWQISLPLPADAATRPAVVTLKLGGVAFTNFLAWLGRMTGWSFWQRFRAQHKNRQLRLLRLTTVDGEVIYDFGNRHAPYAPAFARRHARLGLNVVGFMTADLGIGESARGMVRAADAAQLPTALIDLKLNVKTSRGDRSYAERLVADPDQPVSVFHLDPPAARDIDHHHGKRFRAGRYNIGYWAWELPEFPDAWVTYCEYFDEIWCPSDFVREAIAMQSPVPVLTMPHAITVTPPSESINQLRARFDLPPDRLLFLFLYDLNSYSPRKNPTAVIEAFRRSGLAAEGAALVIKTHGAKGNEADLAALRDAVSDMAETRLIAETLSRADLTALESACDVFVSLHRSEGFGFAVAECMALGKPVIATDWSATAEFLNATNGCPVRSQLIELEQNVGPYAKGQRWAEPDVAHAAAEMRRLAADPALRTRLGEAARHTVKQRFAPQVIGARYRRRLEAIAMR